MILCHRKWSLNQFCVLFQDGMLDSDEFALAMHLVIIFTPFSLMTFNFCPVIQYLCVQILDKILFKFHFNTCQDGLILGRFSWSLDWSGHSDLATRLKCPVFRWYSKSGWSIARKLEHGNPFYHGAKKLTRAPKPKCRKNIRTVVEPAFLE